LSLAHQAVRGAAWTIGTSIGGRLVGVVGTLLLTRFLAPEVLGEVGVASILVLTANQISSLGLGQYVVAKPGAGRDEVFHATVIYGGLGAVALASLLLLRDPLAPLFDAPGMVAYVPGLVVAALIDRAAFIPQRVLLRDMRFKLVALTRSFSEVAFTGVAVGLAASGWGGEAVVVGNLARSALRSLVFVVAINWRAWLEPHRLGLETSRRLLRFGVPISMGALAGFAARRWDNLLFSAMFGPATMGLYNLAYNLADIPAEQVGEHIGDVLLPSFAHMSPEARPEALLRSTSLLALLIFPLAVGLAAVADPLVTALFTREWQGVAPFLIILSVLSIVRPFGWTITSYLQACDLPRQVMLLSFGNVIMLLILIAGLGQFGPAWACVGVGLAYACHALASLAVVQRRDGVRVGRALAGMAGPLAASGVMAGAVLGVIALLRETTGVHHGVHLLAGVITGALVYVPAAFLLAPTVSRDCVRLLRASLRR
jgi:lipopolysaccharide exporter